MRYLFSLLLLISSFSLLAQNFKGKVIDSTGEPILGATVFIKETKQGLICNESGEFQTTLNPGVYSCIFSCLGYETQNKQIQVNQSGSSDLVISLAFKDFVLREVVIDNSGEDPAYPIMRKAIAKAPYYLHYINEFSSEAYLKGTGKLMEISKLMEKMAGVGGEKNIGLYKDKLFLQESFSEIKFWSPDKYEQTVNAFSSTIPDNFDPKEAMGIITTNLYSPMFGQMVSPLNPKAFSYYTFRYEGYDEENGQVINKIKLTPKLKDPVLFEGYLYIAEDTWELRHVELQNTMFGGKRFFQVTYSEIQKGVFLPVTYTIHVDVDVMGVKGVFDYLSSIKYTSVTLNDSLIDAENLKIKKTVKKKTKKSLEIKREGNYNIESDSMASKRDSVYWSEIRNIPLNEEEIRSYIRKDTIQAHVDSVRKKDLHPEFHAFDLITGGRFGGDSSQVYFKYGGLMRAIPEYNFVDGFWLGQSLELGFRRNAYSSLVVKPIFYWMQARKNLAWNVDASYSYAPMNLGQFYVSGGSLSEDYNQDKGMLRIENAVYTLFSGINNARFYQKNYLEIGNKIDVSNGLNLGLELEFAERKMLDNHTYYSFFGDREKANANLPDYQGDIHSEFTGLNRLGVEISYTPENYYYVNKGVKHYSHSRFPTFRLSYQQGFSSGISNSSIFSRLEGAISQEIKLGVFNRLNYHLNAGGFLNKNDFNYIDYKHFNGANQFITGKQFQDSYALLDYYTYSSNTSWIQASVNFNTQYLLLKRLSFLQGKMLRESLHAKFLHTPEKQYYSEWGYSTGIPYVGSIGVFVAFDAFDYNGFGVSVSLPLLREIGVKK